jgi:hypothetical protein
VGSGEGMEKRKGTSMKAIAVVLAIMLIAGVAFAGVTFEVKEGKAVITEITTGNPVAMPGQKGEMVNIPGATRDVTTRMEVTKEQAQVQGAQLSAQRVSLVKRFNEQIANIDAQIKLLKDIDVALPEVKAEEPIQ